MQLRANRNHKDTVFRDLFGSPERKENALSLYNALNGTSYTDPDDLELTTLDDAIYLSVKDDVSFLVGDELVLWEHQSSPNPNMPLRGLAYFARLFAKVVERRNANLYGRVLVGLPTPRYVVFYAGPDGRPERETLRLSDAFSGPSPSLEVTCEVVNINEGMNEEVAAACPALSAYSFFVARVRGYNRAGESLEAAVDRAVSDCVAEGRLAGYFADRRAEVADMFLTEFDAERQRELDRAEGREEGRAEGRAEGVEAALQSMLDSGIDPGLAERIAAQARK